MSVSKKKKKIKTSLSARIFNGLFKFIVGLLLLLLIFVSLIIVFGSQILPLSHSKNYLFLLNNNQVKQQAIYFIHLSTDNQQITVFQLDHTARVKLIGGYGEYALGAVEPLLTLGKKDQKFIRAVFSWALEAIVNQSFVIFRSTATSSSGSNQVSSLINQALKDNWYKPDLAIELLRAFFFTKSIPSENIKFSFEKIQPQEVSRVESSLLEECPIAIVNTTAIAGLASQMSSILENNGAVVVRVTDQQNSYQLSTLVFSPNNYQCQLMAERVDHLFLTPIVIEDNQELRNEQRSELVIYLGEDLAKWWVD